MNSHGAALAISIVNTTAVPAATAPTHDPVEALVRTHQRGVLRFLGAIGCSAALAEELAVDAFVVAFDKGLRPDDPGAGAFLCRTARYLWLRRQRWQGRERARFAAAAEALWQQRCAADQGDGLLDALRDCMAALDGRKAEALHWCYGEGMPHAEAARRLGLAPNGLKTLLQRLRAALRACIERRLS